jgi:Flp pilus assembly protein TadG
MKTPGLQTRRKKTQGGNAMVEVALLAPWVFFLFIGVFDLGFYAYELICVEGATQAAAAQTATSPAAATQAVACSAALGEMGLLPNNASFSATCAAAPLTVLQTTLCGSTTPSSVTCSSRPTTPQPADVTGDTASASSQVTVTYQGIQLIPIPGVLEGKLSLTRVAETKILVP